MTINLSDSQSNLILLFIYYLFMLRLKKTLWNLILAPAILLQVSHKFYHLRNNVIPTKFSTLQWHMRCHSYLIVISHYGRSQLRFSAWFSGSKLFHFSCTVWCDASNSGLRLILQIVHTGYPFFYSSYLDYSYCKS